MGSLIKRVLVVLFVAISFGGYAQTIEKQSSTKIKARGRQIATVHARTNHGDMKYHIDNSGKVDVSEAMQALFNELSALADVSATIEFAPGVYLLESPVQIKMASVKLVGNGHGGIDIHGANLESGTIFRLGEGAAPYAISFDYAGRRNEFPAGNMESKNQNLKVEIENISFVGYNNTGVDTAHGYSRFRGDEPNFRGLHWYPSKDRYTDPEKEGQRAIYLPKAPKLTNGGIAKCELLRVTGCYFTDLYVGIDVAESDVSYINKNWFGQLTYGIRMHGPGQGMMVSENLFADLETAMVLGNPIFSTFSNNTFAYVSKCFEIDSITCSSITDNSVYNWTISTGAAAFGGFCYVRKATDLNITGNTITQQLDSRKKERTIDEEPNGESFIHFDNATRLLFANNIVSTILTQSVVRLNNCRDCLIVDNIITFANGGNAVAQTGNCSGNFYRPIDPEQSAPFDEYRY